MTSESEQQRIGVLDRALVEAAKTIKVLSHLAWPPELCSRFLETWSNDAPELPRAKFTKPDFRSAKLLLQQVITGCSTEHPIERYLSATAQSYIDSAVMLEAIGTPQFTERSIALYGSPRNPVSSVAVRAGVDSLMIAERFIEKTRDFIAVFPVSTDDYCVLPSHVAEELSKVVVPFFDKHTVSVVVDPDLAAKAAAGAKTIRIRGGTCFAPADIAELIHHEAFVHTLTMLNGREQPVLKSLGLGAPRTTFAQEGLAIFAEFITNSIDLSRLRRIALRLKAIHLGLEGADFIEVFKFFLSSGQEEQESFYSTMRIFRGGDLRGGIVNTKDVVYLQGFLAVHDFLLRAIRIGKPRYPHYLFAGRMALDDVSKLEPYFDSGLIAEPIYEPDWVKNRACLTAFLLHSSIVSEFEVGGA